MGLIKKKKINEKMSKYHEFTQYKKLEEHEEIEMYRNFKKVLNTINEKKRLAITKDNIIHCEIKQHKKILTKFIFTKNIHRNNFIFNFERKRILSIVHEFELCLNKYTFITINPLHLNIIQREHKNKTLKAKKLIYCLKIKGKKLCTEYETAWNNTEKQKALNTKRDQMVSDPLDVLLRSIRN